MENIGLICTVCSSNIQWMKYKMAYLKFLWVSFTVDNNGLRSLIILLFKGSISTKPNLNGRIIGHYGE